MARKYGRKGRRKQTPAVMQLTFKVPAGASYVDLALAASIANRRGYKQENTKWAVASFEFFQSAGLDAGTVSIQKLPETWVLDNAYTKTKALYDRMNDQVLDVEPGIEGAYADFKIAMDVEHLTQSIQDTANPTGRILTPVTQNMAFTVGDFNGAVQPVADWDFSILTIPNDGAVGTTGEYRIHAVGPDVPTSKGMIAGYELSRSRPAQIDPNVPANNGWMGDIFDVGSQLDELKNNIENENDRAPYPVGAEGGAAAFYPGGATELPELQIHSFCNFSLSTVSGKNVIMGGVFRNGLIKIENGTGTDVSMIMHMVPGTHRGYLVEEC